MNKPIRQAARLLACAAVVGLGGGLVSTAAAGPAPKPPSGGQSAERDPVDELLERFPIGTEPVLTTPPQEFRPPTATRPRPDSAGATQAVEPRETGSTSKTSDILWLAFIVANALAVASALALLAEAMGRRAVRAYRGRSLRISGVSAPTVALFNQALAQPRKERSVRVTEAAKDGDEPQDVGVERPRPEQSEPQTADPAPVREREYADVGESVIGILQAAEIAATQIRAEATDAAAVIRAQATDAAAEIRRAAEAEAGVYLERAREDAAKVRSEAEESASESRSAAESFGASQRRRAEEQAENELAEANVQAQAIRQAAEEQVRQIEIAARERGELIRAQVRPLEENMRRALEAFRGISAQLEELLADHSAAEESLVEALSGSARQAGSRD